MIYLYGYLGIGTVFLAVIFISHLLTKSPADDWLDDLQLAENPRRDRWWWKLVNKFVVPILAAMMVLAAWPIAIYWKAKEIIAARRSEQDEKPEVFAVKTEHLLKRCTVSEIEAAEMVVDPLDAAPRVPFGHLNPAWEAFKQSLQENDQLWSFSASASTTWGQNEIRGGYVTLRGDTIGPHFLVRRVFIDKEREPEEK